MNTSRVFVYRILLALWLLPMFALSTAPGAFLTSDFPENEEAKTSKPAAAVRPPVARPVPRPDPDPQPRPRPRPQHANPAIDLLRRVQVGTPHRYQQLTIYPVLLAHGGEHSGLRTLDEALRNGWIGIDERQHASVSQISIRNHSRHSIFLMAGEVISGGKQNRLVQHDLILPPHSAVITLPVYCVEKDRWSDSLGEFKSQEHLAHPALRKSAASRESQDSIWREVERRSLAAGVDAKTKNYGALYSDRAIQGQLADCLPHFRDLRRSTTVGAVAVVGNRIVGADLFSDPSLFARQWDKILRSYALEYFSHPDGFPKQDHIRRKMKMISPDVSGFLRRAASASYRLQPSQGAGTLYRISGAANGEAMTWNHQAVHVALFGR